MARRELPAEALLAQLPLLRSLDAAALGRLAALATRHRLNRGDVVFHRGDPVDGMYCVIYGEIRLWGTTAKGGRRLAGTVRAGHSFAEPVMFLDRPAVVTAEAASDALLLQIPRAAVFGELERNPRLARAIIIALSQRIEGLVTEGERQALSNATERFVAYLLHHCDDPGVPFEITLGSTKRAVASQLNLTPEHFSRILQDLQNAQLLQVKGRTIRVPHPERLMGACLASPTGLDPALHPAPMTPRNGAT